MTSRLLVVIIIAGTIVCASAPAQRRASFTILHYNDYHAQYLPLKVSKKDAAGQPVRYEVGGAASFKTALNTLSKLDPNVIVLNAGDNFQGTPISSMTRGEADIRVMNLLAPDAATLGNHEFDFSADTLRERLKKLNISLVSTNLWDKTTGKPFIPQTLVKSIGGIKLGVLGLAPPDLAILAMRENVRGLTVLDLLTSVKNAIHELRMKEKPDLIVVISHMGVDMDSVLASKEKSIDIIVGGHSHTPLFVPKKVGRTVICQAGSNSRYVGELRLQVDLDGDSLLSYSGRLVETAVENFPPDPATAAVVDSLESIVASTLNTIIGTLAVKWERSYNHESNIGNWHADAMRAAGKSDIAFLNSGGLRKDLDTGSIRIRDIWEINPFGNELITFKVTGSQLRRMLEWQLSGNHEPLQVSGITYTYDGRKTEGHRLVSAAVNSKALTMDRRYSITVNDYTAGHLHDIFGLPESRIRVHRTGIIDRDAFIEEVKRQKIVTSAIEGRIKNLWEEGLNR